MTEKEEAIELLKGLKEEITWFEIGQALDMAIEALEQDTIPVKWLEEKLTGHPELSYSLTDGIIAVLDFWEESKGGAKDEGTN